MLTNNPFFTYLFLINSELKFKKPTALIQELEYLSKGTVRNRVSVDNSKSKILIDLFILINFIW